MNKKTSRMTMREFQEQLKKRSPCAESLQWLSDNKHRSPKEAILACPETDWLAWLLEEFPEPSRAERGAWEFFYTLRNTLEYDEAQAMFHPYLQAVLLDNWERFVESLRSQTYGF